ncbi:Uncharacterised protein [Mycobacteroides abscessus subsp. abscessus]|nr:Uncharacterised protein [Mycobacteroides abscessus subsp. abscessus]
MNLCLCLVGLVLAAASVYGFAQLYSYAMNELPKGESAAASLAHHLPTTGFHAL